MKRICLLILLPLLLAAKPENAITVLDQDLTTRKAYANYRLHLAFEAKPDARLVVADLLEIDLSSGQVVDVTCEQLDGQPATVAVWRDGTLERPHGVVPGSEGSSQSSSGANRFVASLEQSRTVLKTSGNYAVEVKFKTKKGGTLFSMTPPKGKWERDAKALFIRGGRLTYDIGWLGAINGGPRVNDGQWHVARVAVNDTKATLWVDGKNVAEKKNFSRPDPAGHAFKIGSAGNDFGGDYEGEMASVSYYRHPDDKTPIFQWPTKSGPPVAEPFGIEGVASVIKVVNTRVKEAWVQPLEAVDHASLIRKLDTAALERGKAIYHSLCITCHGTDTTAGFLPTALKFHEQPFKNGASPFQMHQTLTKGFNLMIPQNQYTTAEKYDVIHYIRETQLKPHNPSQYVAVDEAYLTQLPFGMTTYQEVVASSRGSDKQYEKMNFGPVLHWTFQVADGNIAYKGIMARLDPGPGGVSKGKAWMLYDHDTLRVATAYTGTDFVDWRGIAFDGSHGTHTSIKGDTTFVNPVGPGWANPADGSWEDPRMLGTDDKPYGPLPRTWVQYLGQYVHGDHIVLKYTVGETTIHESPGLIAYGDAPVFTRSLQFSSAPQELAMRVCPVDDKTNVSLAGPGALANENDFVVYRLPKGSAAGSARVYISQLDEANLIALAQATPKGEGVMAMTTGGPAQWTETVTTKGTLGETDGPFAVDVITHPESSGNPYESWLRFGGFDFLDEDRAAICTWMGDVWIVSGLAGDLNELKWKRIAAGMFQPLGVVVSEGQIYVTCRDQLVRLHDLNGDEEIDFYECFNNDHQVTEHFHEFAMGLQQDDTGNFYYAKSARHAKPALVPHHGTLLKVSADGSKTEILANGFRAANGVCLNDDGTFFVTDQEGHWTPKNRINHVRPSGGFYGNFMGYHNAKSNKDEDMEQPLIWITNQFDRSPSELLWVKSTKWGPFNGKLLNLSYGYGKVYVVSYEEVDGKMQGGMSPLPIAQFPTGVMRGRFHPTNGQLYACGMFAWAGTQSQPGGFYRMRYTEKSAHLPVELHAKKTGMELTFSEALDPELAKHGKFEVSTWDLKRSGGYGSKHYNTQKR
ncbi:MAG: cytochrome c5, partial [Verrucomicrobiales bacterium]